jgi:hypothetical protein
MPATSAPSPEAVPEIRAVPEIPEILAPRAPDARKRRETARGARAAMILATLALLPACASVSAHMDTRTSGRFESSAVAFTILSIDLPSPALDIARGNASDMRLTNMQVTEVETTPGWGWWDWVLDIIGVRKVRVRGTWGFSGEEPGTGGATTEGAGSAPPGS